MVSFRSCAPRIDLLLTLEMNNEYEITIIETFEADFVSSAWDENKPIADVAIIVVFVSSKIYEYCSINSL